MVERQRAVERGDADTYGFGSNVLDEEREREAKAKAAAKASMVAAEKPKAKAGVMGERREYDPFAPKPKAKGGMPASMQRRD